MRGGCTAHSLLPGSFSSSAHHKEEHLPLGCFVFNRQANLDTTWFTQVFLASLSEIISNNYMAAKTAGSAERGKSIFIL